MLAGHLGGHDDHAGAALGPYLPAPAGIFLRVPGDDADHNVHPQLRSGRDYPFQDLRRVRVDDAVEDDVNDRVARIGAKRGRRVFKGLGGLHDALTRFL
ncbi:hypothetical protein D9M72_592010 [compost metagenome]